MTAAFSMTLKQVADAMGADYQGEDIQLHGVSTDTRSIQPGELFVALIGPNFDGHEYIKQARDKGAVACMVSEAHDSGNEIHVDDTRLGLGKLAGIWRAQLKLPVIAVTGSNGKTTVKEMLAAIFKHETKKAERVLATRGNLNNDIGLPLTLLQLNEQHQYAVIEMGANHPNEIKYLSGIAQPDIALVTNAGAAHLEGFGSLEGVAKAKGEAFTTLHDGATAIVNADDAFYSLWREMINNTSNSINVVTFGLNQNADVSARWQATGQGSMLEVSTAQGSFDVEIKLLGEHNVMNALAAVATSMVAGVSIDAIQAGLNDVQVVPGRLQLKTGLNGSRVIDDTYNANPTSLSAAIHVLKTFPGAHYLALGDMGELGAETKGIHEQAGIDAKKNGVDHLYTVGAMASSAAQTFGKNSFVFDTHQSAIKTIQKDLNANVTLLVKGSRLSHMEYVVDALTVSAGGD